MSTKRLPTPRVNVLSYLSFIIVTYFVFIQFRCECAFYCEGFQPKSGHAIVYHPVPTNHVLEQQQQRRINSWVCNNYFINSNNVAIHRRKNDVSPRRKHVLSMIPKEEEEGLTTRSSEDEYPLWPFALLLLSQFLLFIGVGAIIPAIPLYGQSIGLSQADNGVVISAPAIMLLLCAPYGGTFADQARKPAMIIGMAMIAISDIGTACATTLPLLLLARLGLGTGRCIGESGERGMLADIAKQIPQLRGRALAAQQAITALAISIGAPLGGYIIESYGPRPTFLCVSAGALLALIIYTFLPETVIVGSNSNVATTASTGQEIFKKADWSLLAKQRRWQGLALCQSGATFGFAAKIASIPIIATATLPGGAVGTGALLSLAGLSGIIGAPFGGWLTDSIGARFTVIFSGCVSAVGLILIPCVLNGFGLDYSSIDISVPFLGGNLNSMEAAFVGAVLLWSVGAASQGPALTALAQEIAPLGEEATALAFPRAAGDSTYIVAPFILGTIADKTSELGLECAFAGMLGLVGSFAFMLSSKGKQ